ncbi:hypothetical protein GALMADRAFT_236770 [Galerina marginata CBS 339.88]|uniref:Uncharacterized protein n=1 Tax=Galerina marginata (strain CBS 339.88) TaxID=685588 RepID=A0A067TLK7_GALM3|nr:hypothetical protein GALMADRAFT_236770 [Galerina marginata CBS 339.88]
MPVRVSTFLFFHIQGSQALKPQIKTEHALTLLNHVTNAENGEIALGCETASAILRPLSDDRKRRTLREGGMMNMRYF